MPPHTPITPPDRIRHLVRTDGESLQFESAFGHDFWFWIGLLLPILVALGGFVTAPGEDGMMVAMMALFIGGPISGLIGWGLSKMPRTLTVSRDGVALSGFLAPKVDTPDFLSVSGPVGRSIVLNGATRRRAAGQSLAMLDITGDRADWTYDGTTWLAQTTADLLGLDLHDARDEASWRRFETDPLYRIEVGFDIQLEDNRDDFMAHHGMRPSGPESQNVDIEGMSAMLYDGFFSDSVLRIDGRHVEIEGQRVRLADIQRVGVFYSRVRTKNSTNYYGTLKVLANHREVELTRLSVTSQGGPVAAVLNWAAQEIRRAAAQSRPQDQGDVQDVPDAIRALASRRTE